MNKLFLYFKKIIVFKGVFFFSLSHVEQRRLRAYFVVAHGYVFRCVYSQQMYVFIYFN